LHLASGFDGRHAKLVAMRKRPRNATKPREVSALLFDYGGTLAFLDFELLASEFSRPGRKLDAHTMEKAEYIGRQELDRILTGSRSPDIDGAYRNFLRSWLLAVGIPAEEFEECAARFRAIHQEATLWRVIESGTFELLEKLRSKGLRLGIVSNAQGQVEDDCKRFGLAPYFDVIIDSHVVGVEKPDPRIFEIALKRLGVAAENALYAGDIYAIDMLGAHAAGIEGKLVDRMDLYDWVDHTKIRGVHELHLTD
jgi:HAD superfamily hydrolase (TIGR01549 family)